MEGLGASRSWFLTACSLTLLFLVSNSYGGDRGREPALQAVVPEQAGLGYYRKPENSDFLTFDGEVVLDGLLLAYWELQYLDEDIESLADSEPERSLKFRFYPASRHVDRLPATSVYEDAPFLPPERIFIYKSRVESEYFDDFETSFSNNLEEARALLEVFHELPSDFFEVREGKAIQAVSATLSGLAAFIEANHVFTYGQLHSVSALSMMDFAMSVIPDAEPGYFLGQPWAYHLWTQERTKLYREPDGEILAEIPAGAPSIVRLEPIENGWVKVRFSDPESGREITGYLDAGAVLPVN